MGSHPISTPPPSPFSGSESTAAKLIGACAECGGQRYENLVHHCGTVKLSGCVGPQKRPQDTDEDFLAHLQRIAEDWRFSDEFIGIVVRGRWPRKYEWDS